MLSELQVSAGRRSCDEPRIKVVAGVAGKGRRAFLEQPSDATKVMDCERWVVSCDTEMGGPWAGVKDFFASLVPEILSERPELAQLHSIELIHILPALQKKLRPAHTNLTDGAKRQERVRNYATDRAMRLVHGLIDLLDSWKMWKAPDQRWCIACDDFDRAGVIGKRFLRELMRRRSERLDLYLTVAVDVGNEAGAREWFGETSVVEVIAPNLERDDGSEPGETQTPEAAALLATELESKIAGDSIDAETYVDDLIRLWKLAGRQDKLLQWAQFATEHYTRLGLYEDLRPYTEQLLPLSDAYAPNDGRRRLWILNKVLTGYMGVPDSSIGMKLVETEVLPVLEKPDAAEHINLFFLTAMMYARYHKPRDLGRGEELLDKGLATLERIRPDDYHFQYIFNRNGVAMIRTFQGRFQEAIDLCKNGIERLNQNLASDEHRLHRSVLVYNIAQVYAAMGAYDEAIEHYTKVIALDPDFSEYHNERGNLLLRVGRLEEAREDYLKAIHVSPPYCEVHTNLGQCYRRMGEFAEAVKCYERALDLEPNQTLALVGLGKAHEELGEREQAIAYYTKALAREPLQWEVLASRGVLHYETGDYSAALADFDKAIELAPNEDGLQKNRAVVLSELSAVA